MDLVQVLPNALKCPCVSIKHALKKQGIKTLKPLISQGFQVSVSILVTQDGCGDRTRTCDLRVMRQSQAQIGVISAPICAFYRHSLGGSSIVSVQPYPLQSYSGSKLGQKILKLQNRSCQPVKMFISESVLFSRCSSSGRYSATVKPTTSLLLVIK